MDRNIDAKYRQTFADEFERRMRSHPNAKGLTPEQTRFSIEAVRREALGGNMTRAATLADELMERRGP